jgi:hypothetical protein
MNDVRTFCFRILFGFQVSSGRVDAIRMIGGVSLILFSGRTIAVESRVAPHWKNHRLPKNFRDGSQPDLGNPKLIYIALMRSHQHPTMPRQEERKKMKYTPPMTCSSDPRVSPRAMRYHPCNRFLQSDSFSFRGFFFWS